MRLSVAVAGLGVIAQTVYLPLIQRRCDLFEITAVCDLTVSLTRLVPSAEPYEDLNTLLGKGGFDALILLTSGSHAKAVRQAQRDGCPVLCEKPLAHSQAEAAALSGDGLMVGYMKQYDPATTRLLGLLEAPIRSIEITVLHPSDTAQLAFAALTPGPDVDERHTQALGERAHPISRRLYSVLLGSVCHDLSLLRLIDGPPDSVDHVAVWPDAARPAPVEPSVELSGRLPSGGRYTIRWHYLPDYPVYRETVLVHCPKGSFELAFPSPYLLNVPTRLTVQAADRHTIFEGATSGFEEQLIAFHAYCTEGRPPLTGLTGGLADIVTAQQAVRRHAELAGLPLGGELL